MTVKQLLHEKRMDIQKVAEKHGAFNLRVFGSVVRDGNRHQHPVGVVQPDSFAAPGRELDHDGISAGRSSRSVRPIEAVRFPASSAVAACGWGAYYAARKSVCEYLFKIRRQARILIFREVRGGYLVPLGVWVIRETVKNAMETSVPIILDNFNDSLVKMADGLMVNLKNWKKSSKMVDFIKNQRTIDDYL